MTLALFYLCIISHALVLLRELNKTLHFVYRGEAILAFCPHVSISWMMGCYSSDIPACNTRTWIINCVTLVIHDMKLPPWLLLSRDSAPQIHSHHWADFWYLPVFTVEWHMLPALNVNGDLMSTLLCVFQIVEWNQSVQFLFPGSYTFWKACVIYVQLSMNQQTEMHRSVLVPVISQYLLMADFHGIHMQIDSDALKNVHRYCIGLWALWQAHVPARC